MAQAVMNLCSGRPANFTAGLLVNMRIALQWPAMEMKIKAINDVFVALVAMVLVVTRLAVHVALMGMTCEARVQS